MHLRRRGWAPDGERGAGLEVHSRRRCLGAVQVGQRGIWYGVAVFQVGAALLAGVCISGDDVWDAGWCLGGCGVGVMHGRRT